MPDGPVPEGAVRESAGAGEDGSASPGPAATGRPGEPFALVWACHDGLRFSSRQLDGEVELDLGDREVRLPRVRSASGERWAHGELALSTEGKEARLERPAGVSTGCRPTPAADPWQEAALRGVALRALGQEPGWELEVTPGLRVRFVHAYGEERAVLPAPEGERLAGGGVRFTARGEAGELVVEARDEECRDAMSGHRFPLRVIVELGGRTWRGCGRRLVPGGAAAEDPSPSASG